MISKEQIELLKQKITNSIEPEKVILFGSYSDGTQNENSDLDLLVIVKDSNDSRLQRARKLRKSLWGIVSAPKDILVYTEREIEHWKNIEFSFIYDVIKHGKVIYERKYS
jgi:uncharacterized protein